LFSIIWKFRNQVCFEKKIVWDPLVMIQTCHWSFVKLLDNFADKTWKQRGHDLGDKTVRTGGKWCV
jgi:hypothetical protein